MPGSISAWAHQLHGHFLKSPCGLLTFPAKVLSPFGFYYMIRLCFPSGSQHKLKHLVCWLVGR